MHSFCVKRTIIVVFDTVHADTVGNADARLCVVIYVDTCGSTHLEMSPKCFHLADDFADLNLMRSVAFLNR